MGETHDKIEMILLKAVPKDFNRLNWDKSNRIAIQKNSLNFRKTELLYIKGNPAIFKKNQYFIGTPIGTPIAELWKHIIKVSLCNRIIKLEKSTYS